MSGGCGVARDVHYHGLYCGAAEINSYVFAYRKLPLISPGLIQLRKGFWVGL